LGLGIILRIAEPTLLTTLKLQLKQIRTELLLKPGDKVERDLV
jgi:hypothetical protein